MWDVWVDQWKEPLGVAARNQQHPTHETQHFKKREDEDKEEEETILATLEI